MDDKERGLYRKYNVSRVDNKTRKHNDCLYFVLDLDHDPHAIPAIKSYIESCKPDYPMLARDLIRELVRIELPDTFKTYKRTINSTTRMRPYQQGEPLKGISVREGDRPPGPGDMIAVSNINPKDQWLVSKEYFEENYEPIK